MEKVSKEDLAKHYAETQNSAYTNDYYGFLAGYGSKEEEIQFKIMNIELEIQRIIEKPSVEKIFLIDDLNRLQAQSSILKTLI